MEYKPFKNFNGFDFNNKLFSFFEISDYDDFEKWDKSRDIVLSIPVYRDEDEKFLKLIDKIKIFKDKVYVIYGLCSHPSILLREAGLEVLPFNKDIQKIEISLN